MKAPITVQLEITEKCNFKCPHCYHLDNEEGGRFLNLQTDSRKVMEIARILVGLEIFNVILTGGEPLMEKELLLSLIEYFGKNNISVSVNTNLVLVTKEFLEDPRMFYVKSFLVSCPSCNKKLYKVMTGNGNYDIFEKKLILLKNKRFRFSVNMVVNRKNLSDIKSTAKHLMGLGIKKFGATPMALNLLRPDLDNFLKPEEVIQLVLDLVWIHDELKMSVDIFEAIPNCIFPEEVQKRDFHFLKRKCQAGITTMAVSNNGDVRPCTHNIDNYGNLLEEDFSLIWNKMSDWRNRTYLPDECQSCKILNLCAGGCRMTAKAFSESNNPKAKDPWMTEVITSKTKKIKKNISLFPEMVVFLSGIIQYRKEDDTYLLGIKNKNNVTRINKELLDFILYLQKIKKSSLIKLAENMDVFKSEKFQEIIQFLLGKKVLKGG